MQDRTVVGTVPAALPVNESEVIRRAMDGDEHAFNALFETYKDYTYKISYFILNDRDDCEDCVNSSWMKIHSALIRKAFDARSKFSTWIYTIVTHEAILFRKQVGRTIRLDDPFLKDSLSALHPEELSMEEKTERKIHIERILRKLSPLQQRIVALLLENYTFPEIAERLGIKPNYLYQLNSRIKELFEQ
jgi:RNA polymerase sigma-70 factor (ECF subfamily)